MSTHQVKLNLPPLADGTIYTPAAAESLVGTATTFDGCPGTILAAYCMKDGSSIHVTIEYERPDPRGQSGAALIEWILFAVLLALAVLTVWLLYVADDDPPLGESTGEAIATVATAPEMVEPEGVTSGFAYMVGEGWSREFHAFTVTHEGLAYDCIAVEASTVAMQCFPVTGGR